jgi:hypothetical protein
MSIGEALLHVKTLAQDPTSWVHAALAEWEHPTSREFFVLADLFDAFAKVNFKRPTPYPRPLPDKGKEQFGAPIEPAHMGDVLRAFGHDPTTLIDWPGYESPDQPKPEPRVVLNPHD